MPGRDAKMRHSDGTKNILMADIAAQAGVSVSTVSRVLSGKSKGTTQKSRMIKNLVTQNGYEVNRHAQMLRATPGIVRTNLSVNLSPNCKSNLSGGITEEVLRQTRRYFPSMDVLLSDKNDPVLDHSAHLAAIELLAPDAYAASRLVRPAPTVRIKAATDRVTDYENGDVLLDFNHALRQAGQHLIGCGSRSILFVGEDDCPYQNIFENHEASFITSLLPYCNIKYIIGTISPSEDPFICSDIAATLDDIDGIIAGSAMAAFAILAKLEEMDLKVPSDIKIVVMEETSLFAFTKPGLTSISFEVDRAISLMLDLFWQKLNGLNPKSEMLQARLTRRASSGFLLNGEI